MKGSTSFACEVDTEQPRTLFVIFGEPDTIVLPAEGGRVPVRIAPILSRRLAAGLFGTSSLIAIIL